MEEMFSDDEIIDIEAEETSRYRKKAN